MHQPALYFETWFLCSVLLPVHSNLSDITSNDRIVFYSHLCKIMAFSLELKLPQQMRFFTVYVALFFIILNFLRWNLPQIFTVHRIRADNNFLHTKKVGFTGSFYCQFLWFCKFMSFPATVCGHKTIGSAKSKTARYPNKVYVWFPASQKKNWIFFHEG